MFQKNVLIPYTWQEIHLKKASFIIFMLVISTDSVMTCIRSLWNWREI